MVTEPLIIDHRRCDELFLTLESALTAADWKNAAVQVGAFESAMKHHFEVEEEELFPALEAATPQAQGPIHVMTMEHVQMLHMIRRLALAIEGRLKVDALGLSETLLMTIQQHNVKEENILYPMADRYVPEVSPRIAQSMKR